LVHDVVTTQGRLQLLEREVTIILGRHDVGAAESRPARDDPLDSLPSQESWNEEFRK